MEMKECNCRDWFSLCAKCTLAAIKKNWETIKKITGKK